MIYPLFLTVWILRCTPCVLFLAFFYMFYLLFSALCADRLSQMTKTYNDIEAVTRLLEEVCIYFFFMKKDINSRKCIAVLFICIIYILQFDFHLNFVKINRIIIRFKDLSQFSCDFQAGSL